MTFLKPYRNYKTKRYFNKNTGNFSLSHRDFKKEEKKIDKILGIQIIGYQKNKRVRAGRLGSMNALFTYFQLIVVMQDFKRYNIATFQERKLLIETADKLCIFLKKPFFNEIENFEGNDEKTARLTRSFRSKFILTDNFESNTSIEELKKRILEKEYYSTKEISNEKIIIDPSKLGIFNSNLAYYITSNFLRPIEAYLHFKKKNGFTEVIISTKFRKEFIIYVSSLLLVSILGFYKIAAILFVLIILFWFLQRSDEKTFFLILKQDILAENKDSNLLNT
ncbi:hypothetical protein [Aquimarina pacifica]|uniref:hypothetical protein n=1 Tax=Aquimarina pacifica TaxID=1296415 RepID=UPI0012683B6C|nr:hypothetical protein [Aquimarina pacifica]